MMARRSRCRSRILGDRQARGGLIDGWGAGPAGAARSAWRVRSSELMAGLLWRARPGERLLDDAAERQEGPMAVRFGERLPEPSRRDAPGWLRWARGGTGRAEWCRMKGLLGGLDPGVRRSSSPGSAAPVRR